MVVFRVKFIKFAKFNDFSPFLLKISFPWSRGADAALGNGFLGVLGGPLGKKPGNALQNHFLMKSG